MIILYRILYGLIGLLILWCLYEEESVQQKITFGILAMPLLLRVLNIK